MKKPDEFNEFIKRQLEENPQEPPVEAWQNISESLDLEGAWKGIEQDLELDNLWEGIDSRLGVAERLIWWNRAGTVLTAVLLLFALSLPFLHSSQEAAFAQHLAQQQDTQQTNQKAEETSLPELAGEDSRSSGAATADDLERPVSDKGVGASSHSINHFSNPSTAASAAEYKAAQNSPAAAQEGSSQQKQEAGRLAEHDALLIEAKQGAMPVMEEEEYAPWQQKSIVSFGKANPHKQPQVEQNLGAAGVVAAPEEAAAELAKAEEEAVVTTNENQYHPWRIGIGASARMSWLMNKKTWEALDKSSLTTSLPSFRKSFSLLAEKRIHPRVSLLGELAVYSEAGQRYEEYQGGLYGTTDTELRYSHLSALLAYSKQPQTKLSRAHNRLLLGVSAGWLHSATLTGPMGRSDVSDAYKRSSLGLLLGYEYMHPLGQQWWVGYGIRGYADVLNIYDGSGDKLAEFRRSRSTSLDFTINFKYEIRKK